jgi:hypothetical protein
MRARLKTSNNKEKSTQQKASGQATLAPRGTQAPTAEHPLLRMQRLYGNRFVQRVLTLAKKTDKETEAAPDEIRRKLAVGQPGDRYEQEAD